LTDWLVTPLLVFVITGNGWEEGTCLLQWLSYMN